MAYLRVAITSGLRGTSEDIELAGGIELSAFKEAKIQNWQTSQQKESTILALRLEAVKEESKPLDQLEQDLRICC